MICRYCGREVKNAGTILTSTFGSICQASPTKTHVAVPDGAHCIYCGGATHSAGMVLATNFGTSCRNSPTKKHVLG